MNNWLWVVHICIQENTQLAPLSYQGFNTTSTNATVLLINQVKGYCGKVIVC